MLMLLYNSLHYAGRVTAQGAELLRKTETMDQLDRFLRQLISQSYPRKNTFIGSSQTLEFIAPISRAGLASTLYQIIIEPAGPHSNQHLRMSWSTMDSPLTQEAVWTKGRKFDTGNLVLVNQLARLEISYRGKDESSDIWLSQWNQEQQPALIRITIKQKSTKDWPEFVIPLPRTHTADCDFDSVSRECREG